MPGEDQFYQQLVDEIGPAELAERYVALQGFVRTLRIVCDEPLPDLTRFTAVLATRRDELPQEESRSFHDATIRHLGQHHHHRLQLLGPIPALGG